MMQTVRGSLSKGSSTRWSLDDLEKEMKQVIDWYSAIAGTVGDLEKARLCHDAGAYAFSLQLFHQAAQGGAGLSAQDRQMAENAYARRLEELEAMMKTVSKEKSRGSTTRRTIADLESEKSQISEWHAAVAGR